MWCHSLQCVAVSLVRKVRRLELRLMAAHLVYVPAILLIIADFDVWLGCKLADVLESNRGPTPSSGIVVGCSAAGKLVGFAELLFSPISGLSGPLCN